MCGLIAWIIGNSVIGSLSQTGAFEIFVNNRLVFSKLAEGKLPTVDVVFNAVDSILG